MPLVDVHCENHGKQEIFTSGALSCPECGGPVKRIWSRGATFRMDFRSGWDMGAGKNFYAKKDRENWIRESQSRRIKD